MISERARPAILPDDPQITDVDDAVKAVIRRHTQLDQALFDEAKVVFLERWEQYLNQNQLIELGE